MAADISVTAQRNISAASFVALLTAVSVGIEIIKYTTLEP